MTELDLLRHALRAAAAFVFLVAGAGVLIRGTMFELMAALGTLRHGLHRYCAGMMIFLLSRELNLSVNIGLLP